MAIITLFLLAGCESEAPEADFNVSIDKTSVAVGEAVTLSVSHGENQLISVYSGDEGHNYQNSADYILQGKTEQQLRDSIWRPVDPDIYPFICNLGKSEVGSSSVADNLVEVRDANSGNNLLNSEAQIINDAGIGQNVLKITSTHPNWWYQAIRVNTNMKLGSNTTMTLRMRFDKDYLQDVNSGEISKTITTFPVVIRLGGIAKGESEVTFSNNTVWDIYWSPNQAYTDYTVDLSRIITEWQNATGKTMEKLAYAQFLFTASGSIGYVGDFYLQNVSYSNYDFLPFDTGESISTANRSGESTYSHAYTQPGTYRMVVIGSSVSGKNYNGSYTDNPADKISKDEYNYNTVVKTFDITVH